MSSYSTGRPVHPAPRYSGDAVVAATPTPTLPVGVALLLLVPPGIAVWAFVIGQVTRLLGY